MTRTAEWEPIHTCKDEGLLAPQKHKTQRTRDSSLKGGKTHSPSLCPSTTDQDTESLLNHAIFQFARKLKGCPELAGADGGTLRPIVQDWMGGEGAGHVQGATFDEVWIEFCGCWGSVKWAAGQNPVPEVFRRAWEGGRCGAAVGYENETIRLLATACKLLQEMRGDGNPFMLSCRTAARQLGVRWRWAAKLLRVLCAVGVLRLVKPGIRGRGGEGTAARYLYTGD